MSKKTFIAFPFDREKIFLQFSNKEITMTGFRGEIKDTIPEESVISFFGEKQITVKKENLRLVGKMNLFFPTNDTVVPDYVVCLFMFSIWTGLIKGNKPGLFHEEEIPWNMLEPHEGETLKQILRTNGAYVERNFVFHEQIEA